MMRYFHISEKAISATPFYLGLMVTLRFRPESRIARSSRLQNYPALPGGFICFG